jgi:cytochrome c-type biogenesis protein CcmH/NrfG
MAGPLWAPRPEGDVPAAADIAGPDAIDVAEAGWRYHRHRPWPAIGAAVLVLVLALAAAWSALQPVRAVRAGDVAIQRLERGELDAAVSVAEIAHERNPLSPEPLWELAYIEQQRGRLANAERALEQAVEIQPASAESWRRLGRFQLSTLNQPADAVRSFRAAYYLDPRNPQSQSDFLEATRAGG